MQDPHVDLAKLLYPLRAINARTFDQLALGQAEAGGMTAVRVDLKALSALPGLPLSCWFHSDRGWFCAPRSRS